MRHEVIPGHHGDLEVQAGLLDDFLYGFGAGQRVHTSGVTHHADTCEGGRTLHLSLCVVAMETDWPAAHYRDIKIIIT